MSKRKGLNPEEKRQRMLQIFYEKKDAFQLKELEKLAPKEKGIVAQSVKEVVQSLVDDSMVDSDKIGTSVYFWAFPSKAVNLRKSRLCDLKEKLKTSESKLTTFQAQLEKAQVGKEDTDDRVKLLEELRSMEEENAKLRGKLQQYKDCDPEVLEAMKKQNQVAQEATNRWTDNIFATKAWCKRKFFMEDTILNKQFGIPEELDYI